MIERIKTFFTEYFKEIREKVKEVIPCVESNLVKSNLNLISSCWEECKTLYKENLIAHERARSILMEVVETKVPTLLWIICLIWNWESRN